MLSEENEALLMFIVGYVVVLVLLGVWMGWSLTAVESSQEWNLGLIFFMTMGVTVIFLGLYQFLLLAASRMVQNKVGKKSA